MAHEIDTSTGRPAFVFDADEGEAWHKLGVSIPAEIANDPAKIAEAAGASYRVSKAPVRFTAPDGSDVEVPNRFALFRHDTLRTLGIFGENYHEVQPVEYFEGFRDELAKNNLRISAAGVLKGGAIVFVNARLTADSDIVINKSDRTENYICLGGGYDGKLASFGFVSSMRTVCWNTLSANLSRAQTGKKLFRVLHNVKFDGRATAAALGLCGEELRARAEVFNSLAGYRVQAAKVAAYFCDVLEIDPADVNATTKEGKPKLSALARGQLAALADAYAHGPGAQLSGTKGTMWGALNAVTFYVDHKRRTIDTAGDGKGASRFASAQFGDGARLKARALELAMARAGLSRQLQAA